MNEELNDSSMIDTELQVRLMNMVMGEASDFERDQLLLLMEQRVELATYYQHLQHMHGLLAEVGQGEMAREADASPTDDVWQLPADKRETLLAELDGKVSAEPVMVSLAKATSTKREVRWSRRWTTVAIVAAASVLLALTLSSFYQAEQLLLARPEFQGGTSVAALIDDSLSVESDVKVLRQSLQQESMGRRALVLPSAETYDFRVQASPSETNPDASWEDGTRTLGKGLDLADVSGGKVVNGQDANVYFGNTASANDFGAYSQVGDNGIARGDSDSPSFGGVPDQSTISVPDGGTILLGGIQRYSNGTRGWERTTESKSKDSVDAPLPMTVTPRIHITEEEEAILLGRTEPESPAAEGRATIDQLRSRVDPVGTKEVEVGQLARGEETPSQAIGADTTGTTSLFGDVQTEFIEDLDLVIIKGAQRDVERTMKAIDSFKGKQSSAVEDVAKSNSSVDHESTGKDAPQPVLADSAPSVPVDRKQGLSEQVEARAKNSGQVASETQLTKGQPSSGQPSSGQPSSGQQSSGQQSSGQQSSGQPSAGQESAGQQGARQSMTVQDHARVLEELRARVNAGGRGIRSIGRNAPAPAPASKSKSKDEQIATLTEDYNDLMDEGRFAEAELMAKQVGVLEPDAQIAKLLTENARMAKRDAEYESVREAKADNYTDLMNRIDKAFVVPQNDSPLAASDSTDGEKNRSYWKYTPPSPQIASNSSERFGLERKPAEPKQAASIDEQNAAAQAFSTFSLHVSDVSFKLAQATLAEGQWPEAAKVRIEEFVNALDYHDPLPTGHEKVACRIEQAMHPSLMQRNLLRVSMRTAASGRSQSTPLRLTIVLDNSGSMERPDRRQAVLQAVQLLVSQLRASDQVTLISFANTPRLLAENFSGGQGAELLKLIENLPSEGGTNIEAALSLARQKALEQKLAGAQNRIVMLTDGAVNLGNANPESLSKLVTELRDAGIAFDAAGISAADLNDEVLEALTRQGDGRYYLLDSAQAAGESFAAQIAGALRPSAQNVKVQVEFNPKRVGHYKLLGFEKHRLNKEDFRNDKVDAAEMAAAEAGVAVYHYEIKPNGSGDVGSVSVRFRDLSTGQMVERRWPIPYDSNIPRLEQAEPTMQLATVAALFAAKLGGGPLADSVDLAQLQNLISKVSDQYASQPRVVQLRTMIDQAKAIGH